MWVWLIPLNWIICVGQVQQNKTVFPHFPAQISNSLGWCSKAELLPSRRECIIGLLKKSSKIHMFSWSKSRVSQRDNVVLFEGGIFRPKLVSAKGYFGQSFSAKLFRPKRKVFRPNSFSAKFFGQIFIVFKMLDVFGQKKNRRKWHS